MKRILVSVFLCLAACSPVPKVYPVAENAFDAGREFIEACLKGDFEKAAFYMMKDSVNSSYLKNIESIYRQNNRDGRQQLREASINIREVDDLSQDSSIINYNNSFDTTAHKVKVIRKNGQWQVDLKYTYNPNL